MFYLLYQATELSIEWRLRDAGAADVDGDKSLQLRLLVARDGISSLVATLLLQLTASLGQLRACYT